MTSLQLMLFALQFFLSPLPYRHIKTYDKGDIRPFAGCCTSRSESLTVIPIQPLERTQLNEIRNMATNMTLQPHTRQAFDLLPSAVSECTICLGSIGSDEDTKRTPCDHTFHSECLKHWVASQTNVPLCPNCRKDIFPTDWQIARSSIGPVRGLRMDSGGGRLSRTVWAC